MMQPAIPGGFLLVFEGIDGAGKTSQAIRLAEYCGQRGLAWVSSKEPTNGPYGRKLRASAATGRLGLERELEYFLRDRAEHVQTVIRPALERGEVVILDRYYFSTMAYQGALGADVAAIQAANAPFAPEPDLLVLLDLPAQLGLARIHARGDVPNLFERVEALERARTIFHSICAPYLLRIDALLAPDAISAAILQRFRDGVCRKIGGNDADAPDASWRAPAASNT